MSNLDAEIVGLFIDEAIDLIVDWEKSCLTIAKNLDDPSWDEIFRAAHNLKGASMSVGLQSFGDFIHQIEDTIKIFSDGKLKTTIDIVDFLLECQSLMADWLPVLRVDENFVPDLKPLLLKATSIKDYAEKLDKGARAEFKDFGTIAVESGAATQDQVIKAVNLQNRKLGEIMVDEGMISEKAVTEVLEKQKKQKAAPQKVDERIRVSANKIDELIQLIGELSIHQSIVRHAKRTSSMESKIALNAVDMGEKICREVQTYALSLRMFPVEGMFQKLERVVTDIARAQGKLTEVLVDGIHVDLDKTIIEKISDPLVHMVRNSIDHGIETAEERKKTGKPAKAVVKIEARQDASGVVLTISDNGRGLNVEKIRKKAIEKGLISEDQVLADGEIFQFIFESEFSTASETTEYSGRGVGMDVVKTAVDSVGGFITIDSLEGQGTTFTINLPTSLSIIEVLTVVVSGRKFLVPLLDVHEIIDLDSFKIETSMSSEKLINLRGHVVPVHKLSDYFITQTEGNENGDKRKKSCALVIEVNRQKIAFEVDGVVGQGQIVIRPLNDYLEQLEGFSGGSILNDGEAGMIIGIKAIAQNRIDPGVVQEL